MRRHLVPCLAVLAITACSEGSKTPPPPTAPAVTEDAPPGPDQTTSLPATPPPAPPPEPEWVPPVLPTRSAGCGKAMPDAHGVDYTTPSGRTFHVWGPSNYDPNKAHNVVYTFHGMQTEGRDFEAWFQMEKYVNDEAIVVYPDAIGGFWDLAGTTDLAFFDEMSKMMNDTYCTDPSRALGFGFSYGGIFMNVLGCKRAGYVKAIAIGDGSGGASGGCGRLPVLITARTADTNETVSGARGSESTWTKLNGCSASTSTSNATMNCVSHASCRSPGSLTFCEDTYVIPSDIPGYDPSWQHTVREPYRQMTYDWFAALP